MVFHVGLNHAGQQKSTLTAAYNLWINLPEAL